MLLRSRNIVDRRIASLLVMLLAFGLRVVTLLIIDMPPIDVSESGQTAANLIAGQGYTFDFYGYRETYPLRSFMPPLYTGIIAGCMLVMPDNPELVLGFVQAILSSLTTLTIFGIGQELFGRRVALLAATVVALYPVFLVVVAQPTVTVVNSLLLGSLIWLLLLLRRLRTFRCAAGAGIILGLSALNRPLILIFLPPLFWWLWLVRVYLGDEWWRFGALIALVTVIVILPWTARNVAVHRAPVLISTNGGFTFWNGNNPFTTGSGFDVYVDRLDMFLGRQSTKVPEDFRETPSIRIAEPYPLPTEIQDNVELLSEVELDRALYVAGLKFIYSEPRQWFDLMVAKARALWWFRPNIGTYRNFYEASWVAPYKVVYTVVLSLAIMGSFQTRRDWRTVVLLYLFFGTLTVGYVSFNVITRYRWEIESLLILLACVPVEQLTNRFYPTGFGDSKAV